MWPTGGATTRLAHNRLQQPLRQMTLPLNIAIQGVLLVAVLLVFPLGIVGTLRKMGRLPAFVDWA